MKQKIFVCLFSCLLIAAMVFSVSAETVEATGICAPGDSYDSQPDSLDETEEQSYDIKKAMLISYGVGLLVALITVAVMYGQLKSVRKQQAASQYIIPGSLNVTYSSDVYLYRNVTKIPVQKNNSDSSR